MDSLGLKVRFPSSERRWSSLPGYSSSMKNSLAGTTPAASVGLSESDAGSAPSGRRMTVPSEAVIVPSSLTTRLPLSSTGSVAPMPSDPGSSTQTRLPSASEAASTCGFWRRLASTFSLTFSTPEARGLLSSWSVYSPARKNCSLFGTIGPPKEPETRLYP